MRTRLDGEADDDGKGTRAVKSLRKYKSPRYAPRLCALCRSEHRDTIEGLYLTGRQPVPALAAMCGLHRRTVQAHLAMHLPERLMQGRKAREEYFVDGLWGRIFAHEEQILADLQAARMSELASAQSTIPALHRELTAIHRLQAEIRGLVKAGANASVTVHNSASPDPQVWQLGGAEMRFMPDGQVRMFAIPVRPHQLGVALRGELPGQRNGGDAHD